MPVLFVRVVLFVRRNLFAFCSVSAVHHKGGCMYLLKKILNIEPGALSQIPISISRLRAVAGMEPESFDRELIRLSGLKIITMQRLENTTGLTDTDLAGMLIIGEQVFSHVAVHPDIPESFLIGIQDVEKRRSPERERPPELDFESAWGGARRGAGRKPVPAHLKRERFKMIRLPMWIQDWLKGQPDAGKERDDDAIR